jgi:tetratricopeptide (TPR) repeat protein
VRPALWIAPTLLLGGILALVLLAALERRHVEPTLPSRPPAPPGAADFDRGLAQLRSGRADEARRSFDAALQARPAWAEAHYNRALARRSLKDLEGARADLDRALALRPGLRDAWYNRGLLRLEQGDAKGAVADYDEAVNLQSDWADAYFNRGQAKERLGDADGALRDYVRALESGPRDWPHHARAVAAIEALRRN